MQKMGKGQSVVKRDRVSIGLLRVMWLVLVGAMSGSIANEVKFHDVASTVMMNSLKSMDENRFLNRFYRQLFFVPVWVKEESLSHLSRELFFHIQHDKTLDSTSKLKASAQNLMRYAEQVYQGDQLVDKIKLEFEIAQLYKGYADYKLYGSINWGAFQAGLHNLRAKKIEGAWVTYKPQYGPISLMEHAVLGKSLGEMFEEARPKEYNYDGLERALLSYLELQKQGGWEPVPIKGKLVMGKNYTVVPALRERLRASGDYIPCKSAETKMHDKCLHDAVVRFQKRHGLVAKGVIGPKTIGALNVSLEDRIKQIRLNLDRIKWLYERNQRRHIIINIPAFTLFFEQDKQLIQQMKVIIGSKKNRTPIFSNLVQTIVLNPHWNVPQSIIQNEMIPKLLRNKNAMKKEGIEIYTGWDEDAKKISGKSVDWKQYRYSKSVPYRFAQVPGHGNALGKVKFLFPNEFSVYMHDTPNKNLFNRNVRALSHGCIRLHKPRELLKTFASFNERVDYKRSQKILKGKKKAYYGLDSKVPVDVVYLTAYVDYDGVLQFRNDIYGYDAMQLKSYRKW
jgi:murein L,D-transpeptidase YcbB/YkuD